MKRQLDGAWNRLYRNRTVFAGLTSNQENSGMESKSPSPASSCGSIDSERADSSEENTRISEEDRPPSPAPTSVSLRSDYSRYHPIDFKKEEMSSSQSHKSVTSEYIPEPSEDEQSNIKRDNSAKQQLSETWKNWILSAYESELTEVEFDSELFKVAKNVKHMDKMVETYCDLFTMSKRNTRTVLTKGVAGVGKTFHTRRMMVNWAKKKSNPDIDLMVPLHFVELNTKAEVQSIVDLLNNYLSDAERPQVSIYEECKVAFILDGLENCKLPLDFKKNKKTD